MRIINILLNKLFFRRLFRFRLSRCGSNFRIGFSSEINNARYVSIGSDFYSGPRTYIGTSEHCLVQIKNSVMFGAECMIIGGDHDYSYNLGHMISNNIPNKKVCQITIEDGAWIGSRSILLSGCHIGEGAIVGAMSLVNNYIPPYCIAVGAPAKKFKRRFDDRIDMETILNNVGSKYKVDDINEIYKLNGLEGY